MSKEGQDIQNLTRQEFQKRLAKKLGIVSEGDDSVELESHGMSGKQGLEKSFTFGKRYPSQGGRIIPVKAGGSGLCAEDSLSSGSTSRDFSIAIQPPTLPLEEPSIILVPGDEPVLPQDKKIPTKHTPKKSNMGGRALVIPAANSAKKPAAVTRRVSTRSAPALPSPSKIPWSTHKLANFTMGSVPVNTKLIPHRKSQKAMDKTISPSKPRITRSVSARSAREKQLTIRPARSETIDIQIPVKFDGGRGKRKYAEVNKLTPSKRMKLNGVSWSMIYD